LNSLAREAGGSPEYLRRKCQQELGRSPMHQVTYMRMQQAQSLLETRSDKLEVIAALVGYTDPQTFGRAFRRWIGCSPGDYRHRQ
jgi:AraC-like DNA-binding protein